MRGLILPFTVVFLPQMALATIQHGLSVLAPEFTAAAGLPPEAVGLVGGLVGLGSVWFFASSGAVLPVLGPVRALTMACFLGAAAAAGYASQNALLIFLLAPLVGFAYGITAPAGSQILSEHTPRRLWGTLFSLRMAGVPAGGAIAGIAGAGLAAAIAWRAGLGAIVLPALFCGAFLLVFAGPLRGPPQQGRLRLAAILAPANIVRPFAVLRAMPGLSLWTFSSLGFAAVQASSFTFLTTYLTDGLGLSLALAGSLFAAMQVASFAGRIGMGLLADRLGSVRRTLVVLGCLSASGAVLLSQAQPGLPVAVYFAAALFVGAAVATWNGLFLAQIAIAAEGGDVAAATSASTFFTFIGYMATPPVFALLSWGLGYRAAYLAMALCVLTAVLFIARAGAAKQEAT